MKRLSRRMLLGGATSSAIALSLRSAITGLPLSFLLTGEARAAEHEAKVTILSCSGAGEQVNVCGPGTFEPELEDFFDHPRASEVDIEDAGNLLVNGIELTPAHLEHSAEFRLGDERVRMARCFEALQPDMLEHMVYFHHRTNAGIHPQFGNVLLAHGQLAGPGGRGAEQLPAAIAQETAPMLGTLTDKPFVLSGGGYTASGAALPRYTPTQVKTLAASVGLSMGGAENFGALYDHFIDEHYAHLKREGTAEQRRFLDQHASSRRQASAFGTNLGNLLDEITDDSIDSQMKTAAAIAKLKLAPVVITDYDFGGDNHHDYTLSVETNATLKMMRSLDVYWSSVKAMDALGSTLYATVSVFGRHARRSGASGGRGHEAQLCSGLVVGSHFKGRVVGGLTTHEGEARCSGINSATGRAADADVPASETLYSYYKTLMLLAGVPSDRRDVRLPQTREVTAII